MADLETQVLVATASVVELTETPILRCDKRNYKAGLSVFEPDRIPAHVLDAVARILLSSPDGEVYAVGAQIHPRENGRITLTIASSHGIPEKTVDYVEEIWELLTQLSREYRAMQKRSRLTALSVESLSDTFVDLVDTVYSHCLLKWKKWIDKHYAELDELRSSLEDRVRRHDIDSRDEPFNLLYYLIVTIGKYHDRSIEKIRRMLSKDANSFAIETTVLHTCVEDLRQDEKGVKNLLGDKLELLWPYLRKVTSLHSAIIDLDNFARSHRMSPILEKMLCINRLPAIKGNTMPSDNEWDNLVDKYLPNKYERDPKLRLGIVNAKADYSGKGSLVHCEINILKHFSSLQGETPPLSYIGVSKLICMACWTTFEAWNIAHERPKYQLRGSHGRWQYPWAVPLLAREDDALIDYIRSNVTGRIILGLRNEGLCSVRAESTVTDAELHETLSEKLADSRLAE